MTDVQRPVAAARALIILLALSFLTMLCLALKERLWHPHLTVHVSQSAVKTPMDDADASSEIGSLMRQAAEDPKNIDVLLQLVEHLVSVQSWEAAETFAQRAVVMDTANPKPLYLLGIILHNTGRHKEAADVLERVVTLKDEASVRYSLGVLYLYFLNEPALGVKHLEAGLQDTEGARDIKLAIRAELDKYAEKASAEFGSEPEPQKERKENRQ
ncbi:MAG: hypothetical protein J5861_04665 [Desulfovibrio sp.]|nr:hypothetical protein [Desulfovibrio sp.]